MNFLYSTDPASADYLEPRHREILAEVAPYFTPARLKEVVIPILEQEEGAPSLRVLDYLCTNYSKSRQITCSVEGEVIFMHSRYKAYLRTLRRRLFDPFRRKNHIHFDLDGKRYSTTVGQLNFLQFARQCGVLAYAKAHAREIEDDMAKTLQQSKLRKMLTKARRVQLSQTPVHGVHFHRGDISPA